MASARTLPSLVADYRERTRPPDVPPKRSRSEFDSDDLHKQYMQKRRKAQERLREYGRPLRNRKGREQSGRKQSGRARPARKRQQHESFVRRVTQCRAQEQQRQLRMGIVVPVGLKEAPMPLPPLHNPKSTSGTSWCCDFRLDGCIKPLYKSPEPSGDYEVWVCEECDWCMCMSCIEAGASVRCQHTLLCLDQDGEELDY